MAERVVFACVHSAGRSQIAAAWFNAFANPDRANAVAAGTEPAKQLHPEVIAAMREEGLDLSAKSPRLLDAELMTGAALVVTMGCGEKCPFVPGVPREDWPFEDPKGQPPEVVGRIRDQIRARVEKLLAARNWR